MQEQERIRALYAAITATFGNANYEGDCVVEDFQLWLGAEVILRVLAPTDEQIGRLLLYRFGGTLPALVAQVESVNPKPLEPQKAGHDEIPILEAGMIPWAVEVDGIPTQWMLNYNQAHLPVKRGGTLMYQGRHYRVSRIYGTTLFLTSQESDTYAGRESVS